MTELEHKELQLFRQIQEIQRNLQGLQNLNAQLSQELAKVQEQISQEEKNMKSKNE